MWAHCLLHICRSDGRPLPAPPPAPSPNLHPNFLRTESQYSSSRGRGPPQPSLPHGAPQCTELNIKCALSLSSSQSPNSLPGAVPLPGERALLSPARVRPSLCHRGGGGIVLLLLTMWSAGLSRPTPLNWVVLQECRLTERRACGVVRRPTCLTCTAAPLCRSGGGGAGRCRRPTARLSHRSSASLFRILSALKVQLTL